MDDVQKTEKEIDVTQRNTREKFRAIPKNGLILLFILLLIFGPVIIKQEKPGSILANFLLTRAEKWTISYVNTFDDDQSVQLSQWKPTDGEISGFIRNITVTNGHLEISFAPTQETVQRDAFVNEKALAQGDFLLTAEINAPLSCHTGLVFRDNAMGEYYAFLVGNDSFTVEILRRNSAGDLPREAIIPNTAIPENVGVPHKISVLASLGHYSFYINNIFVGQMRDSRLDGDRNGIEVFVCQNVAKESIFTIDNFTLKMPGR
jgi:hypothetical protein